MNAGYSALTLLAASAQQNATLTSFDLGEFGAPLVAKRWIDAHFPGRHTLVLGDSRKTILARLGVIARGVDRVAAAREVSGSSSGGGGAAALEEAERVLAEAEDIYRCDLVFIDGGHEYDGKRRNGHSTPLLNTLGSFGFFLT